jgi:D-methionine transport system permease protein
MVAVILVLIVLVMLVQAAGDALAQQLDKRKVSLRLADQQYRN